MKKIIYTLITILLFTAGVSAAINTLLSVGANGLSITSGTVFSVQGLVLTPSADVSITSNSITISAAAITNGSDQSIKRVYTFTSPQTSYSGSVGIQYTAGELNGNTESALQLAYNALSSGGAFVVTSGSSTGSPGSYYVSNTLSSADLGVVTALPTPASAPTVTTTAVTIFDATSATLGGEITDDGGAAVSERGVVYSSTNTNPEIGGGDVTQDSNGDGTGTFSESIGSLTESTTYYFQAYAINSAGTSYGGVVSFTTLCAVPGVHLYHAGSLINDYCTIQAAVDASQDGDSVLVDAGTYVEQVTITTGITLRGAGRDITIIQSPDKNSLGVSGGDWKNLKNMDVFAVVGIKATNDVPVVIKDLRVDGNDQGYFPDNTYPGYPDLNSYEFSGIAAINTTVTIDNVYVTSARGISADIGFTAPPGYPEDQPLGYNHNSNIFAESSSGAGPHTFTLTNSYITKFQKTAILAWGPTLTVDIDNNTIQGYGKTMWSTGNGIQIASSDRTGSGGANGDRRGTTGSITNNQILDIGFFPPAPGEDGYYEFNPWWGGSTGILLWEAGDGFIIEGNTVTRSEYIPSWNSVTTSNNGGYSNMGIYAAASTNVMVTNNTVFNFDEGLIDEAYIVNPNFIATGNTIYNNTHDYFSGGGNDYYSLSNNAEVIAYYASGSGVDTLSGFGVGDKIYVNDITVAGCVNGLIGGVPTVDFTGGTVTEGDGSDVAAHSVQIEKTGTQTYLFIDTDGNTGQAELVVVLNGVYETINFVLDGAFVKYQVTSPPTISITSPADGSTVYNDPITVNGTAADVDGNLSLVEVKLNGGTWQTATGTDTWTIDFDLEPGQNTILARAKDDTDLYSDTATINVLLSVQIINIPKGWSAISSYLKPLVPELPVMMDEIITTNNLVIMLGGYGVYWPSQNYNTIGDWNSLKGYKVKMDDAQEFTVRGDTLASRSINLAKGYHIIPVLSNEVCLIDSVFADPLNDIFFMYDVKTNALYWPQGEIFSLTTLEPGKGYIANFNKAVTLTYPAYSGLKSGIMTDITEPEMNGPWPLTQTGDAHFIAIGSEVVNKLENASFIGAFDSYGNCIGYTQVDGRGENYLLSVFGNDAFTDSKDGAEEAELISFRSYNSSTNSETELIAEFNTSFPNADGLYVSGGQSGIINFKESSTGIGGAGSVVSVDIYPNPAKDVVNIITKGFQTLEGFGTLMTTEGKLVKTFVLTGNQTQLYVQDLQPGIYILRIENAENVVIKRLVIR